MKGLHDSKAPSLLREKLLTNCLPFSSLKNYTVALLSGMERSLVAVHNSKSLQQALSFTLDEEVAPEPDTHSICKGFIYHSCSRSISAIIRNGRLLGGSSLKGHVDG